MDTIPRDDNNNDPLYANYTVNIQMVTFILTTVVIIMTLLYFIRIYSEQKSEILKDMQIEARLLESVIEDHLNYSKYFINIIGRTIQKDPLNIDHIKATLSDHFAAQDLNKLFGWRKYSWTNQDFLEIVSSTRGIENNPRTLNFIKKIVQSIDPKSLDEARETRFSVSKSQHKQPSLKLVDNIFDQKTHKYIGSVILSYDIETMVRSLNNRKKKSTTNFVIIDDNLNVVASSKQLIDNIIGDNEVLDTELANKLSKINFAKEYPDDIAFLDMFNGVNYFIRSIRDLPFNIIVNIDTDIIQANILDSVTKKFVEASLIAAICLFMVISIYKRETALRAKAEKATDAANKAARAKTDFLAFTAHEIRSPLGFILTGSEIMTKELLGRMPEAYMQYASGIHANSQLILDFITDILDENQIIEGQFKIINSISDISEIMNEAFKINIARYNKKKVQFVTNFAEDMPLVVCDRRRILQVFNNLISNSIKYSRNDDPILVSTSMTDHGLEIQIADKGIGMKQEDIPIALSLYGTLQKSSNYSIGSYGLGLPIVKMLLDAHGAALKIKSKEGHGTTVKIIFPKYKLVYNGAKKEINGTSSGPNSQEN